MFSLGKVDSLGLFQLQMTSALTSLGKMRGMCEHPAIARVLLGSGHQDSALSRGGLVPGWAAFPPRQVNDGPWYCHASVLPAQNPSILVAPGTGQD